MSLLKKLLRIKYLTSNGGNYDGLKASLMMQVIAWHIISNNLTEYYCVDHGVEMKFVLTQTTLVGFIRNKTNTFIYHSGYALISDNNSIKTRFGDIENIFDEHFNTYSMVLHQRGVYLSLSSALACIERDQPLLSELYKVRHLKADTHEVNDIIVDYIIETTDNEYRFTHGTTRLRFQYRDGDHEYGDYGRHYNIVGYICNHNYLVVYSYTFGDISRSEFKAERAFMYDDDIIERADECLDNKRRSLYSVCMDFAYRCDTDVPTVNEFIPSQTTKSARNF